MNPHVCYLSYVIRHKYYVFLAGLELGVPLTQLVVHDWHKFLPNEWSPYKEHFYGNAEVSKDDFDHAWLYHHNKGKHHWQYWVVLDNGDINPLPMPDRFRREMIADWRGCGKALTGSYDALGWYTANRDKILLHYETRAWVEEELEYEYYNDVEL